MPIRHALLDFLYRICNNKNKLGKAVVQTKRAIWILNGALFAAIALYPIGKAILSCFDYTLEIFCVPAFAIIIAVLSVCVVVLDITYKNILTNKAIRVFVGMIAPLSMINTFLYLLANNHIAVHIGGAVCFISCCIITIKHTKPLLVKILSLVISALLVFPTALLGLIVLFPIGQNTVVQTLESPSGRYYAEVVDSDQGALGGDTLVNVYENRALNLLLIRIKKEPQLVYLGEWGEFENMKIQWKDDHCILINSVEYEIE